MTDNNLQNQVRTQLGNFQLNTKYAIILTDDDGRRVPAFATVKKIVRQQSCVYHLQTVKRFKNDAELTFWFINLKGDLVHDSVNLLTHSEWQEWIDEHKSGILAK